MTLLILVSITLLLASSVWAVVLAARTPGATLRVFAGFLVLLGLGITAVLVTRLESWTFVALFESADLTALGMAVAVSLTVVLFSRVAVEQHRVQQAFGAERAYLAELLENSPEAIVLTDPQGLIRRVNRPFTELFGYTPEEILGRDIDSLLMPQDLPTGGRSITQQVASGQRVNLEAVRQKKNGILVEVVIIGAPVRDATGQIAVFAIYRDITEHKRLERELRRLEKAVETTQLGVTVTDIEGKILYTNPAEAAMHGWSVDELLGRDVRVFAS
ncbi:MAG: PAS domain S-box protein, partial [Gemmatimonadota bacterium]|nr:PAS domain S-box protein [Gemmatimonadota bacterium]